MKHYETQTLYVSQRGSEYQASRTWTIDSIEHNKQIKNPRKRHVNCVVKMVHASITIFAALTANQSN